MITPTALVARRSAATPDRSVVRVEERSLTYHDLDTGSQAIGTWLLQRGIGSGGRVATMFANSPEAILTWLGIERAGAVEIPINIALRGRLLAEQLEASKPDLVLAQPEFTPTLEAAATAAGLGPAIERVEPDLAAISLSGSLEPATDDTAIAMILFTSGTTGRSKGVMLPHRSTMRLARGIVDNVGLGADDVLFTTFPLFHIAARFVSVVAAMLCDGEVVIHRRFSASGFWHTCRAEGVTAIHYLGTLPMMLYNQRAAAVDRDHSVRVAYGAGLPPAVAEDFEKRFGLTSHELYGSTEQGMVAINRDDARRTGSCGRPVSDVDLEIHNESDHPVETGDWGEIVVRPRAAHLFFAGYDGMPEATLASWGNLWFHTGDLGRVDTDGFLFFGGRIKEAIRRRGENISAWEVERAISGFGDIADVAAVGVPSQIGEEEVLVAIVAKEPIDWAALVDHCAAELPSYAVPRYFRQLDVLPRTSTDRVEKYKLVADGVTADTWDRTSVQEGAPRR
ncbi:MAG: AMP-binding protein [bacterium]|nr:AMP-binding protein [bacterium]